jgi:response regulator of citrate/malate metabolism
MIRTLIVEDDPAVAEVNRGYLDRIPGFAVVGTATTGGAALAALDRTEVDLVLLDFNLPDISGLDVCRALRARQGPPVDVIAVTAKRDLETVRTAVAQGVILYLIKPYSFATFSDKLTGYAGYHQRLSQSGLTDQHGVDRTLAELRRTPARHCPQRTVRGDLRAGGRAGARVRRVLLGQRRRRAHRPGAGERAPLSGAPAQQGPGAPAAAVRHSRPSRAPLSVGERSQLGVHVRERRMHS